MKQETQIDMERTYNTKQICIEKNKYKTATKDENSDPRWWRI